MIGNNPQLGQVLSFLKDSVLITSYTEDNINKGNCFQVQRIIPVTNAAPVYIVLDTTALVTAGRLLFLLPLLLSTSGGNCKVETYPITSYTGGTEIKFARVNSTIANFALSKVFRGAAVTGTPADEYREYSVGTKSTNQSSGGGTDQPDVVKQFPAGTIITAKISTIETAQVDLNFGLVVFELPVNEHEAEDHLMIEIKAGIVTKIATGVKSGVIRNANRFTPMYFTTRATGAEAPAKEILLQEKALMFATDDANEYISSTDPIDIYVISLITNTFLRVDLQ